MSQSNLQPLLGAPPAPSSVLIPHKCSWLYSHLLHVHYRITYKFGRWVKVKVLILIPLSFLGEGAISILDNIG